MVSSNFHCPEPEILILLLITIALYTYVNVFCLYAGCTIILKAKEVAPLGRPEPNKRFFQEDLRLYREYRRSMAAQGVTDDRQLGQQILREWAVSLIKILVVFTLN